MTGEHIHALWSCLSWVLYSLLFSFFFIKETLMSLSCFSLREELGMSLSLVFTLFSFIVLISLWCMFSLTGKHTGDMEYDLMHLHSCVELPVCAVFEVCGHSGFQTSESAVSGFLNWKNHFSELWSVRTTTLFHIGSVRNFSQNVQPQVVLFWLHNICVHALSRSNLHMLSYFLFYQ